MTNNENKNTNSVKFFDKNSFCNYVKRLLGLKHHTFEESVSELINEHKEDTSVHTEEKVILQNIITFGDREVSDVMIPRTDINAVSNSIKIEELRKLFVEKGHSRMPVYKDSIDEVIGFIHLKDLFRALINTKKVDIKEMVRDIIYVPRTMKVTDMLTKMKQTSVHIAIVLDEYGGTDGLVTIEDVVEEVIGEIDDEYSKDNESHEIDILEDGSYIFDAKTKIELVQERLRIKLAQENPQYDTIGGFIITYLERIPLVGEKISHPSGANIEIIDADSRKVKKLKISTENPVKTKL